MPKFGLKCFLGSFLLSLVAVFAAAKAYIVLTLNEKENVSEVPPYVTAQAQNIELFAVNEETDPLYEKFNELSKNKSDDMDGLDNSKPVDVSDSEATNDETDGVLYAENEELEETTDDSSLDIAQIADADDFESEVDVQVAEEEQEQEPALEIADAKTAPVAIPLVHHFNTEAGTVTVSDEASAAQIALASHDVAIDNLGTENKAAVTEDIIGGIGDTTVELNPAAEDSPWEVAETANKHSSKNTLSSYKAQYSSEASAMDQGDIKQVAENNAVPYKMQKNLLVPIPEDIMNETDMTPQLSTSAENKKIEADLRAKHELPDQNISISAGKDSKDKSSAKLLFGDNEDEDEEGEDIDDETSRSLTESIAAWFSSAKDKPAKNNKKIEKKIDSQSNRDQSNSIFQKLLGIGSENVTPTELKLSFQPNRAEISGQTLEWLHAFSENAVKYENVLVEIRISKSAPYELQQKRLKLLYRILANNGVEYNKVNIIFTDREQNSFIIRNVRYATEEEQKKALAAKTYSPWY
ncbi:MAG: hypothetical protein J6Y91_01405 [Alphaproteobacteria bacterium]|nr:hypothetical protein [Alphaproteobacteria bacterium]